MDMTYAVDMVGNRDLLASILEDCLPEFEVAYQKIRNSLLGAASLEELHLAEGKKSLSHLILGAQQFGAFELKEAGEELNRLLEMREPWHFVSAEMRRVLGDLDIHIARALRDVEECFDHFLDSALDFIHSEKQRLNRTNDQRPKQLKLP